MNADTYTKSVLTVIAAALLLLVVRSFQNPPGVLAEQAAQQTRVQHVILDDVGTRFSNAVPVVVSSLAAQHVIVDDVSPILTLKGIPVSQAQSVQSMRQSGWEYSVTDCSGPTLVDRGLAGWELVAPVYSASHAISYNTKTGQGYISGLVYEEKNNETTKQFAACYFKKRSGG